MTLDEMDAVIGLGKPASKTADWIVDTYLPNSPVSYRLSIEHAIATAIVEANRSPVGAVPVSALRELVDEWRQHGRTNPEPKGSRVAYFQCAGELEKLAGSK